jgi:glycosyltransferase involved in cell wall biosynthesis
VRPSAHNRRAVRPIVSNRRWKQQQAASAPAREGGEPPGSDATLRLGIFTDPLLFRDGAELTADRAYLRFVLGLAERVEELVLFGRVHPVEQRKPYLVAPQPRVRHVSLPYYPRVSDVRALTRALRRSRRIFAAELDRLDAVWIFAPNPLGLEFARIARGRRVPVALAIRQDFPQYVRHRFPGRPAAHAAGHALEQAFRLLARRCPTVVVGTELERAFSGRGAPVLAVGFSQVAAADLVPAEEALARSWEDERRVVSVGRLEPEKNPVLLAEVLALLLSRDRRWRLEVIGEGHEREALARRAAELGVESAIRLSGYVPAGDALWARYRASNAFLHVSLTEGVPSVLFEAQAAGLPLVATDVGGVGTVVEHGRTGLLVPPADAPAAAAALDRVATDESLRRRLVTSSLADVSGRTSDVELDRIAAFLERHARRRG